MPDSVKNPQQQNKLINQNMNKFNKLTTPPDPFNTLLKDPKYKLYAKIFHKG